jgi:hypothetical protein
MVNKTDDAVNVSEGGIREPRWWRIGTKKRHFIFDGARVGPHDGWINRELVSHCENLGLSTGRILFPFVLLTTGDYVFGKAFVLPRVPDEKRYTKGTLQRP